MNQKIFKFRPIYKEKVWGGEKIKSILDREPHAKNIGESWEIADYENEISIIINGEFANQTFREVLKKYKVEILGAKIKNIEKFPLLIKFIDAKEKLSVQVHPNDSYVKKFDPNGFGKMEAWIVLDSEKDSSLICGFSKKTNAEEYTNLLKTKSIYSILNTIHTRAYDSFLIKPGTIHSIGSGLLILEIQESSDYTYRVYDFDRPRELHLKEALEVLNFNAFTGEEILKGTILKENDFIKIFNLTTNEKFRINKIIAMDNFVLPNMTTEPTFQILIVLDGECFIKDENIYLKKGDIVLISSEGIQNGIFIETEQLLMITTTVGTSFLN